MTNNYGSFGLLGYPSSAAAVAAAWTTTIVGYVSTASGLPEAAMLASAASPTLLLGLTGTMSVPIGVDATVTFAPVDVFLSTVAAAAMAAVPGSTATITPSLFGNYAFDGVESTILKSDAASKISLNIHKMSITFLYQKNASASPVSWM